MSTVQEQGGASAPALVLSLAWRLCAFRLVSDALTPLEKERRCFRLVGGVLVEARRCPAQDGLLDPVLRHTL